MQSDDEIIVNRCLQGDQAAFAFLVEKYKGAVHAYAYHRVRDYQKAQDIVQEVFIKAYRKLAQLKWPHRFQSWLYTIASNECSTWLREHLKEREQEVPLEDVPAENLDELAVRAHSDKDIELTVRSAMETLSDDSQLALSLYYMSGLSIREVAGFMGISPNNVGVKLHRARKQLGERLEKMLGKQLSKEKLRSWFTFTVMDSIRDMPIPSLPKPRPIRWAPIPISIGLALLIGIIGYGVSSGKDVSPDVPVLKSAGTTFAVSLLSDTDRQTILDMESENISDLVAANVEATTQIQPATGTEPSGMVVHRAWEEASNASAVEVSPDGRYVSYINWNEGKLGIHDLDTGESRDFTEEGGGQIWDVISVWSPDSKQIAYLRYNKGEGTSICIVGTDGAKPRVLHSNQGTNIILPQAWSRDGRHILAFRCNWSKKTGKIHDHDFVLISVADSSIRVLGSMRLLRPLDTYHLGQAMSLSPDGRYVAYYYPQSADLPRNYDISLLATDGGRKTTLVEHPADDFAPFWTPDGNGIVFASDRSGSMGVWGLEIVDGKPKGTPRLLSDNLNGIRPLGLTQDGSYYYELPGKENDIYFADLDTETGKAMTPPVKAIQSFEGFNYAPAFSPDGKRLAYTSIRPRGSNCHFRAIVIRSLETGEERELSPELTVNGHFARWSPDGRSILASAKRTDTAGKSEGIYQIDTETGAATPVVLNDEQGNISPIAPVWSPDGKRIFFKRGRNGIRTYDLEAEREWKPDFQLACGEGYGAGLALSPDGQHLAFMVSCDGEWSLQIAPSSGGDAREIARLRKAETHWGWGLTWTPDGRRLLLLGNRKNEANGLCELWQIPVEGGEPQKLDLMIKWHLGVYLSFHPDGRRIAFTGPGPRSGNEVWAMENILPKSTASR